MNYKKIIVICSISVLTLTTSAFAIDDFFGGENSSSTATSDQDQSQGQGQNQAMGGQSNSQNLSLTFGSSTPKRGVHISPDVKFPGLVADITGPANNYGPNFTRMLDLLKYKSGKIGKPAIFTREELEPIAEATETFLGLGDEPIVKPRYFGGEKLKRADKIAVTFLPLLFKKEGVNFAGYQENFQPRGYFHSIASADNQVTLDILAVVLINVMDHGINAMDVISEGSNRELYANGWGIGFNTSGASLNDLSTSSTSVVGGGGTGFSTSTSGFNQMPWIQGHLGYRSDL